jgi:hypothetical protein
MLRDRENSYALVDMPPLVLLDVPEGFVFVLYDSRQ